jgi:hypothetical protein
VPSQARKFAQLESIGIGISVLLKSFILAIIEGLSEPC